MTTTARAVAEARRAVHETFASLAAWDADKAREALARLEDAVEQHIREQVSGELFTEAEKTASADTDPSAKARSAGLYIGAQIACGTNTTRSKS